MNTKLIACITVLVMAIVVGIVLLIDTPAEEPTTSVIVQGKDLADVRAAVESAGGEITHELGVIRSVGAVLTESQLEGLEETPGLRIHENRSVEVAGKPGVVSYFPQVIGADLLHLEGVTGRGVTIAVLDTGTYSQIALNKDTDGNCRNLAQFDAITDELVTEIQCVALTNDDSGHGSHVTSVALSSLASSNRDPLYFGVAPDANYVSVKAFDATGNGTYADVIRGIDWVRAEQGRSTTSGCSTAPSAPPPRSHYWDDPLNQAVMAAWQAGIVVVASAGNTGPDPMTIGVPGNVPVRHHRRRHDRQLHARPIRTTTSSPPSRPPARPTRASSSPTSSLRAGTCSA